MNSLELYLSFQRNYLFCVNTINFSKSNDVRSLINQIYKEIFNPPFVLEKSPFMREIINMVNQIDYTRKAYSHRVFLFDAYVIIQGLVKYMRNQGDVLEKFLRTSEVYLFNGNKFDENQGEKIWCISCCINEIKEKVDEARCGYDLDRKRKLEKRMEQNRVNIQLWHEEQAGICVKLMEMQPAVSQLLKSFMSFSNQITEQYVLQFARMEIELFNLISDNYSYHKNQAEFSGNQDYINASLNYNEFMASIIDNLAAFGIEEISSNPGTQFDGAIHEPNTDYFSTKTALVEKSIRSGFRYKEVIIQKEKIIIKQ